MLSEHQQDTMTKAYCAARASWSQSLFVAGEALLALERTQPEQPTGTRCICGYDARNNERDVNFDCPVHYPDGNPFAKGQPAAHGPDALDIPEDLLVTQDVDIEHCNRKIRAAYRHAEAENKALRAKLRQNLEPVSDEEAKENSHTDGWGVLCWYRNEIDRILANRATKPASVPAQEPES
jgi:hypothetical protein